MFYCEECGKKHGHPTHGLIPMSIGLCEICNETHTCFDHKPPPTRNTAMSKIIPTPGRALVQLKGFYETAGSIVIPETVFARRKCEAKLLSFTAQKGKWPRADLMEVQYYEDAVIIVKPWCGIDPFEWEGKKNLSIVLLDDIEAWSPEPLNLDHSEHAQGAIPRCGFCGPAISQVSSNAELLVQGPRGFYCPRCNKDQNGIEINPDEILPITDDQAHRMLGSPRGKKKTQVGYGS